MSLNVNTNTPFDNHYQKSGLQSAAPVTPTSATPGSETAPETPAVQAPAAPEAPLADTTDVSGAGSRVYAFAEKDISFGSRLTETGKTKATQAVTLETDDPAHLGAAKMLSEEGLAAYQDGDYEAATLFYEAACDYDKKSPVLAYNLACAYQKMGDDSSASEMFEVAKGLDPLNRDLAQRIEDRTAVA